MNKQRKTSAGVARVASRVLKDKRTSRRNKIPAASALSQRAPKRK